MSFIINTCKGLAASGGGGGPSYALSKAWQFDGVNEAITVPAFVITNNLTIESVFKSSASGIVRLFNKRDAGGVVYQHYLDSTTGVYVVEVFADAATVKQYKGSVDLRDGNPHQVAFTFASNVLTLYVDGAAITPTKVIDSTVNVLRSDINPIHYIGAYHAGFTAVTVGRTNVWDTTVLSAAEIAALYDSGNFTVDPTANSGAYTSSGDLEMALLMEADDGIGTDTVIDATGNGNDGTTVNMESGDLVDW